MNGREVHRNSSCYYASQLIAGASHKYHTPIACHSLILITMLYARDLEPPLMKLHFSSMVCAYVIYAWPGNMDDIWSVLCAIRNGTFIKSFCNVHWVPSRDRGSVPSIRGLVLQ